MFRIPKTLTPSNYLKMPNRTIILAGLWLVICFGYCIFRFSFPILIRDDSSVLATLKTFPSLTFNEYLEFSFGHFEESDREDPNKPYLKELPPYDQFIGGY